MKQKLKTDETKKEKLLKGQEVQRNRRRPGADSGPDQNRPLRLWRHPGPEPSRGPGPAPFIDRHDPGNAADPLDSG